MKWYTALVTFDPPAREIQVRICIKQEVSTAFAVGDRAAVSEVMRALREFRELKHKKFSDLDVSLDVDDNQSSGL